MEIITVKDIRPMTNGKVLKAFADIQFNGMEIRDFRIIQHPDQKAYVVAPQTSWRNHEGKMNFKPIISMPDAMKWQIESAILAEYQRAKEKRIEQPETGN